MSPQSERCGNSALLRLQQTATRHAQPRRDAAWIRTGATKVRKRYPAAFWRAFFCKPQRGRYRSEGLAFNKLFEVGAASSWSYSRTFLTRTKIVKRKDLTSMRRPWG